MKYFVEDLIDVPAVQELMERFHNVSGVTATLLGKDKPLIFVGWLAAHLRAVPPDASPGDAGRGFAVVADEVRKLAEKTMAATKEVGEAIKHSGWHQKKYG